LWATKTKKNLFFTPSFEAVKAENYNNVLPFDSLPSENAKFRKIARNNTSGFLFSNTSAG